MARTSATSLSSAAPLVATRAAISSVRRLLKMLDSDKATIAEIARVSWTAHMDLDRFTMYANAAANRERRRRRAA